MDRTSAGFGRVVASISLPPRFISRLVAARKAATKRALGLARTARARRVHQRDCVFARSPRSRATCEPRRVRLTDPERDVWKRQGAPPKSPARPGDTPTAPASRASRPTTPHSPPPEPAQAAILAEARRIAELGDDIDEDALDAELARMTAEAPEEGEAYPDDDDDPAGRAGASAPTLRPEDVDLPPRLAAWLAKHRPRVRRRDAPPRPRPPRRRPRRRRTRPPGRRATKIRPARGASRPRRARRETHAARLRLRTTRRRRRARETSRTRAHAGGVGRRAGDSRERRHHRRGEGAGARRFGSRTRDGSSQRRGPRGTTRTERTRTWIRRGSNR